MFKKFTTIALVCALFVQIVAPLQVVAYEGEVEVYSIQLYEWTDAEHIEWWEFLRINIAPTINRRSELHSIANELHQSGIWDDVKWDAYSAFNTAYIWPFLDETHRIQERARLGFISFEQAIAEMTPFIQIGRDLVNRLEEILEMDPTDWNRPQTPPSDPTAPELPPQRPPVDGPTLVTPPHCPEPPTQLPTDPQPTPPTDDDGWFQWVEERLTDEGITPYFDFDFESVWPSAPQDPMPTGGGEVTVPQPSTTSPGWAWPEPEDCPPFPTTPTPPTQPGRPEFPSTPGPSTPSAPPTPTPSSPAVDSASITTMTTFLTANTPENPLSIPATGTTLEEIIAALTGALNELHGLNNEVTVSLVTTADTTVSQNYISGITVELRRNPVYRFENQTIYFTVTVVEYETETPSDNESENNEIGQPNLPQTGILSSPVITNVTETVSVSALLGATGVVAVAKYKFKK